MLFNATHSLNRISIRLVGIGIERERERERERGREGGREEGRYREKEGGEREREGGGGL